ncbi:holliday junction resolvase [Gordonia phage Skog]|uniref:Holliday junction resolvase n=1 Tax=Gordonia phage Skog TaxID=2704033 RepID=A0A6G6XJX7_9CAUD|nr:Holliday junction resolvase [Gordonia phage Skog]QIG58367.1 holliday junction resolvase [Gordonia phage Skog]
MSPTDEWQKFEDHVNETLGLERTAASGSQWHSPGDGVDNTHYDDSDFLVMADAKYTENRTFTLSSKFLGDYEMRAAEAGKRFVLPIRFANRRERVKKDFVVLSLDDFAELLTKARGGSDGV